MQVALLSFQLATGWRPNSASRSLPRTATLQPAGRCVLKGTIARPLVSESRAGSTDTNSTTEWVVLDLDGLPETIDIINGTQVKNTPLTIDMFLAEMGLGEVSYIVQWSASHGISDKRIRAHVFMLLDRAYARSGRRLASSRDDDAPMLASVAARHCASTAGAAGP